MTQLSKYLNSTIYMEINIITIRKIKKPRSIPPITSTARTVKNPNARLAGLANMSLGRYMSERKHENDEENDFDITKYSKSEFNKKSEIKKEIYHISPKIISHNIDIYDENDKFTIILEFIGFNYLSSEFIKINDNEFNYHIPINFNENKTNLNLILTENTLEYKIDNIIEKIEIPNFLNKIKLLTITIIQNNSLITINYEKL